MVTTSADEETPLVKEDDEDNSSLDFVSRRTLDHLNLVTAGVLMMAGMFSIGEDKTADTSKSSIRKAVKSALFMGVGITGVILLWFVFVLIATKKGCPCEGGMRLWLNIMIATFALAMCISMIEHLWLNVPGRADGIIDEIFSSDNQDTRKWSSELGRKLELDTQKRFKRLRYGCLIFQCILWLSQALQYCLPFYGAFCLYRALDECCGLLYYTCLTVTLFAIVGMSIELNNWRKGVNPTANLGRGGG